MKFCDKHWDALRQALDKRGLTPLISKSGEELHERVARSQIEGVSASNFDPLMTAHMAIVSQAIDSFGPHAITDGCPVCVAVETIIGDKAVDENGTPWTKEDVESHWIEGPAEGVLMFCREQGYMPKLN